MKRLFKIFIFLFLTVTINAQTNVIDSLRNTINTSKTDTTIINSLNDLSNQLIRYNIGGAIDTINLSIKLSKKANYDNGLAEAFKIKAILYYYIGIGDSSFIFLDSSLTIYNANNDYLNAARVHNNTGILLKAQGDIQAAINEYLTAIELFKKADEKRDLVSAYINLSNVYRYNSDFQRALSVSYDALNTLQLIDNKNYNDSLKTGHIYKTIANIYSIQKDYVTADSNYNIALEIYKKLDSDKDIADIYVNLSTIAEDKNDYRKIINYNLRALDLYSSARDIAVAEINISNAYIDLKNYDSAQIYIDDAFEKYTQLGSIRGLALANYTYGRFYYFKENYQAAVKFLPIALNFADTLEDYELISKVSKISYLTYKQIGNFNKALKMHEKYKSAEDSIFSESNEKQLTQLALTYDFEKEKQQTEIQHQEEIKRQKIVKNFMLLIILISILGLISLFSAFRTKKLKNEELRTKNEEILQQQEEIIAQNEEIEQKSRELQKQRDIAVKHKNELAQKNHDIEASIHYALRIQKAVLPTLSHIKNYFSDFFFYYIPRDIVSGDFYWTYSNKNKFIVVAADCTGHGVPGAFMSMLGLSFLNQIVSENQNLHSNEILAQLRDMIIKSLKQNVDDIGGNQDGMDLSLIIYDKTTYELEYSGAYNSAYILSNSEPEGIFETKHRIFEIKNNPKKIYEIKADRMPIGIYINELKAFNRYTVKVSKNDRIYLFSDGYHDLYNRKLNKKFSTKRYKELLLNSSHIDLQSQLDVIDKTYKDWVGEDKQIDDILVIGLQV